MSDLPRVFTVEPLNQISDKALVHCATLPHWTLTEALFFLSGYEPPGYELSGHEPPGYESIRHMQDHFWSAYGRAVRAIQLGDLCRKIEQAGKTIYVDRPTRWLAWADSIGPKRIKVDERVRRALSQLNAESRSRGGSRPRYHAGLQHFIDQLAVEFKDNKKLLTPPTLKAWLVKNAILDEGYEPTPAILDCDDIEFNGSELLWKDHKGSQKSIRIRSVDRYISRAK